MLRHSLLVMVCAAVSAPVFGQTAPAAVNAAPGFDLSGIYASTPNEEITGNPSVVDYLGLPISEGARAWALAWDPSRLTLPEHQCEAHTVSYTYGGPGNLRIWEERDPESQALIAIRQYHSNYEQNRTIWMDGRPHPPEGAAHTWMGFSTGKWEGNTLTVYTTHIKKGDERRNGTPSSDQATLLEHFILNGNYLIRVGVVNDPIYLTEPLVKTRIFTKVAQEGQNWLYPCEYVEEIANRPRGAVPHYLPGENPFLTEFADKFHIPREAVLGGAETMYPEYQLKLKKMEIHAPVGK
jgi:hypothetical protein